MSNIQNRNAARNSNLGGQYTLGLFGLPGSRRAAPATEIVTALFDGDQYRALASVAKEENRSVRALIRLAAREYLDRRAATVDLHAPAQPCTADMNAVAAARDAREAFPDRHDHEDVWMHFSPGQDDAGYVEFQLAND